MDIGNGADTGEDRLTLLGRLKRDARRFGLAPWPVIDSLVDLMGAYGEDFAPQPLIFKEFRLLSSFTDQAMSFAGGGLHRRAWDEAMLGLRQKVSGALEEVVPGVHQVDATDPNATTDDLIASMIAQQHPGYTQEQLVDAMNDPDSDDYKAAFRAVAETGALSTLWNAVGPFSVKTREPGRDQAIALNKDWGAALASGQEPTPEHQNAHDLRALETASGPLDRTLTLEQDEYRALGTDR
jgi:hypothetical protein